MNKKENIENKLKLIPKVENYIYYMLQIIMKLPRIEKFNIENEYKISMYQMLENIMMITKLEDNKKINKLNSKNISICEFKIELGNKSKIIVKAYNEKADYCYKKLYRLIDKKRDINKSLVNVIIVGRINNKSEIEVKEINIL